MSDKKGLDEIAAVERLFTKEYGEAAARNFRSDWDEAKEKKYLSQLHEASKKRKKEDSVKVDIGGVLIPKSVIDKKSNRSCPVCKTYSFSSKDDLYMNRFNCCFHCYVDFVQGREDRWDEGYIPDQKRIQASLNRRKKNG